MNRRTQPYAHTHTHTHTHTRTLMLTKILVPGGTGTSPSWSASMASRLTIGTSVWRRSDSCEKENK